MTAKKMKATQEENEGYLSMKRFLADRDLTSAIGYYGDDLHDEDESGANRAVAEYLLSGSGVKGLELKFVSAMLDKTAGNARHEAALSESTEESEYDINIGSDECGTLINMAAQIVFELPPLMEEASPELCLALLKKVATILEGFIDEEDPDRALLVVYATAVQKLTDFSKNAGDPKSFSVWLKKCVYAGNLLVSVEPKTERYRQALAYFLASLGDTMKGEKARECYRQSVEHLEKLRELGYEGDDLLHDLSVCYDKLGDADTRKNRDQAREWYLKCLALREQLIASDSGNYKEGMFATPLKKLLALKGKCDVPFYEKLLTIADKAGDAAPDDTDIQLLVTIILNEVIKTDPEKNETYRGWLEMEAKALERVVARDEEPRYFWWLSESYSYLGDYCADTSPNEAIAFYHKSLDNKEKVIEIDGGRLCYSCGMRDFLLKIDRLTEKHAPKTRKQWYQRWLSVTESCESLCDDHQIMEHRSDINDLKQKLSELKK